MDGKTFDEKLRKRICPCCKSKLEVSDCIDDENREWVSCPGYPYCPTRMVVDKLKHYISPFGRIACTGTLHKDPIKITTDIDLVTCESCRDKLKKWGKLKEE